MARTARGEVVAGYLLGELEANLIKTTSPRESQEKLVAASATRLTAETVFSSLDPFDRAASATNLLKP
jgi:hypothetical protein